MSRTYAKVKISIWGDGDFRELSDAAQALYFRILTSPTLSLCGVADWRPRRIAALTSGMTVKAVREAADELEEALYIVTDEDTEEVLVRTFIRHDGVLKTPNIAAAMVKDYAGTASALLRGVIVHELHRLRQDEPEMKGWPVVREVLTNPSIDPSGNPSGKASPNPSPNPSGDVSDMASPMGQPNPSGNESHIPQPSTLNPQPPTGEEPQAAPRTPKRATQVPEDWRPPKSVWEPIAAECPDVDLAAETRKFVDHFRGTGKPMKDWDATWRNWIRRAAEWDHPPKQPATRNQAHTNQVIAGALARAASGAPNPFMTDEERRNAK